MRSFLVVVLLTAVAWLSGCALDNGTVRVDTVSEVDAVHLMASPTAISVGGEPRADAFQVRVQFYRIDRPEAVVPSGGEVEFAVYDGRQTSASVVGMKPLKAWVYTPAELDSLRAVVLGGVSYELMLRFDASTPMPRLVTMVASFRSRKGTLVSSAPTLLATASD